MIRNGIGFIKGLLIGGVVGSGFALLYAPKSGKKIRYDIGKKVTGWKKGIEQISKEWLDTAHGTVKTLTKAITGHN